MKKEEMVKKLTKKGIKNYESMEMESAGSNNFCFDKDNPTITGKILKIVSKEGDNGEYQVATIERQDGSQVGVASSAWTKNHFKVFKPGMIVRFDYKGKKGKAKVIEVTYAKGILTDEMREIIFTPSDKKNKKKNSKKK